MKTDENPLLPWEIIEEILEPLNLTQPQKNIMAYTITVALYKNILEFLFLYRYSDKNFIKKLTAYFDTEIRKINLDQTTDFSNQLQKAQLETINTIVDKLYQAASTDQKITILNRAKSVMENKYVRRS